MSPSPATAATEVRWSTVGAVLAATVFLTVLAVRISDSLVDVAGLTSAAVCLALLTSPLQQALQRLIGSAASITATAILTLVVTVALGLAVLADLRTQTNALADEVLEQLAALRPGSLPDRVFDALQVDTAIAEWSGDVPTSVVTGQGSGTAVGRQLMSLFFVVILAAFLQAGRRSFVDHVASFWPRGDDLGSASTIAVRCEPSSTTSGVAVPASLVAPS